MVAVRVSLKLGRRSNGLLLSAIGQVIALVDYDDGFSNGEPAINHVSSIKRATSFTIFGEAGGEAWHVGVEFAD